MEYVFRNFRNFLGGNDMGGRNQCSLVRKRLGSNRFFPLGP